MAADVDTDELTSATIMILRRLRADAEAAIKLFEKIGADPKLIEQLRLSFEECENTLKALIVDVHHADYRGLKWSSSYLDCSPLFRGRIVQSALYAPANIGKPKILSAFLARG